MRPRFAGQRPHGYTQENRESMYAWFGRATGSSAGTAEPTMALEEDRDLVVHAAGTSVARWKTRAPCSSFTRDKSQELARQRGRMQGDALRQAVASVLKLPAEYAPADRPLAGIRCPGPRRRSASCVHQGGRLSTALCLHVRRRHGARDHGPGLLAHEGELGIASSAGSVRRAEGRAILYVAHRSSDTELRHEPLIREVMQSEPAALCSRVTCAASANRMPNTCGTNTFDEPYGCDYFYAIHSLMLDRPYLGQKTLDVLRVLEWLAAHGYQRCAPGGHRLGRAARDLRGALVSQRQAGDAQACAHARTRRWPSRKPTAGRSPRCCPTCWRISICPTAMPPSQSKQLRQIEPWGASA